MFQQRTPACKYVCVYTSMCVFCMYTDRNGNIDLCSFILKTEVICTVREYTIYLKCRPDVQILYSLFFISNFFFMYRKMRTQKIHQLICLSLYRKSKNIERHCFEGSRSKALVSEFKMLMDLLSDHVESQMTICFVPRA